MTAPEAMAIPEENDGPSVLGSRQRPATVNRFREYLLSGAVLLKLSGQSSHWHEEKYCFVCSCIAQGNLGDFRGSHVPKLPGTQLYTVMICTATMRKLLQGLLLRAF